MRRHGLGYTSKNIKVALASLACVYMASEHGDRKVKHESYGDVIDMEMSTFETIGMSDR